MDVKQHYAALLGLGEEWTVTNVALDVAAMRVDIYVEYANRSAICPECGEQAGIYDRLAEHTEAGTRLLKIDYDRYAHGEAVLGWLNGAICSPAAPTPHTASIRLCIKEVSR